MKRYRAKCSCGNQQDFKDEKAICPNCSSQLISQTEGRLVIFRKAMYMSCDKKFEIFLNEEYYGTIECKQTVTICLPYGAYTVHFKCGVTAKCKDITVELTPETPEVCLMTRVKMQFWKNVVIMEECSKEDLAKLEV